MHVKKCNVIVCKFFGKPKMDVAICYHAACPFPKVKSSKDPKNAT